MSTRKEFQCTKSINQSMMMFIHVIITTTKKIMEELKNSNNNAKKNLSNHQCFPPKCEILFEVSIWFCCRFNPWVLYGTNFQFDSNISDTDGHHQSN
ncbi:hypothetical protein DERF_002581 [Dermatophagoides farinae]|uniref:Uncharacterized protein n=1 Tax=Dermatophagoides farinae TaxID=6954 RepID=A0A922ID66_DERFA|nr:hypothetical protein DERF_002581 [Dermatophagoides farinae]